MSTCTTDAVEDKNSLRSELEGQMQAFFAAGKSIKKVPGYTPKAKPVKLYSQDPLHIAQSRGSFHSRLDKILASTPMDIPTLASLADIPTDHLKSMAARNKIGTQYLLEKLARAIRDARS